MRRVFHSRYGMGPDGTARNASRVLCEVRNQQAGHDDFDNFLSYINFGNEDGHQ